jgi:outer membrane protein assembly factor BamE (lipoprotein component of BamABCDE complex)
MVKGLIILMTTLVVACATSPLDRFNKLRLGMYKGTVLDIMGSPTASQYKNDEYVWTYRYFEDDMQFEKEVRIKNEIVTQLGNARRSSRDPFDRIEVGSAKSKVLDLVGFPKRVEKKSGKEVWTYSSGTYLKTVVMAEDHVVGFGAPQEDNIPPPASEGFVAIDQN